MAVARAGARLLLAVTVATPLEDKDGPASGDAVSGAGVTSSNASSGSVGSVLVRFSGVGGSGAVAPEEDRGPSKSSSAEPVVTDRLFGSVARTAEALMLKPGSAQLL